MGPLLLVVEDDTMLCDLLRIYLENEGYQVMTAQDGVEGLTLALSTQPALIVLDLMLPRLDGFEVCSRVRSAGSAPVILLTARDQEQDKLRGFAMGADDYLTKPFSMKEFLARVRAVLKRTRGIIPDRPPQPTAEEGLLTFPALLIDHRRHRVERNGAPVALTPKEFDLLWQLASRSGAVIRREELLQVVWGYSPGDDDRTIHTHVNRLRAKLEGNGYLYIHTVWGVGYKFEVMPA